MFAPDASHVIRTGRDQVHAVDLDPQAVVGETADRRQTGNAAGFGEAQARDIAKQGGGIAGRRTQDPDRWRDAGGRSYLSEVRRE
jgi:hypothetical protein